MNVSGLATRAGKQMNKWNYNIANTLFPFYVPSPGERGHADKCPLFSFLPYQFLIFHSRNLFSLFFNLCISFHLFTYVLFFWLYFQSEDTKQIQFSLEISLCEKYSY